MSSISAAHSLRPISRSAEARHHPTQETQMTKCLAPIHFPIEAPQIDCLYHVRQLIYSKSHFNARNRSIQFPTEWKFTISHSSHSTSNRFDSCTFKVCVKHLVRTSNDRFHFSSPHDSIQFNSHTFNWHEHHHIKAIPPIGQVALENSTAPPQQSWYPSTLSVKTI